MRLICGLVSFNGASSSEERVRRMVSQMDVPSLRPAVRIWQDGPAALVVLDFSRQPQSASGVPVRGSSVIAADVRLDEPDALRRTLGCPATCDEDEMLLATLEQFGVHGTANVLGDFAFASWNMSTQRLTCGRDIFGVRPFAYVHRPGEFFAFASFPKALYGSGIVPKRVDQDALARNMILTFRADDCLIAGIKRLPAAHVMEVSSQDVVLTRYWQLDKSTVGKRDCSPDEAARGLRQLVDRAVQCRFSKTGEIGAHLSGGLDSSAVAVLAARELRKDGKKLRAYSFLEWARNDVVLEDETEFVAAVLEQESDIDWTPIRPAVGLPEMNGHMDADKMIAPYESGPERAVCARAEEQGVDLILSGWGGDEAATYNGRGALLEMFARGRWSALAHEISALNQERDWSKARIVRSEFLSRLLPGRFKDFVRAIMGRAPRIAFHFRSTLSTAARRRLSAADKKGLSLAPLARQARWQLITGAHIAERNEKWAQIGSRHGVAFAHPLLDRRVVEFALSLPSDFFLRDGFRRRPFRDAMRDVLPDKIRRRHTKFMPLPGVLHDVAEKKGEFLAQLGELEKNDNVHSLIDLEQMRKLVSALPPPRNEFDAVEIGNILGALQAMKVATYLVQHGGDTDPL